MKSIEILISHLNSFLTRQVEAGKVLSKDSESKLRAAVASLQALLDKIAPATEAKSVAESAAASNEMRALIESYHEQLIEAEISHDETRRVLYNALRANRYQPDGTYIYRYLRDVYESYCIYEQCIDGVDRLFKCAYSIDENGAATLGDPTEVRLEIKYVELPVATTEADKGGQGGADVLTLVESCVPLVEKAVKADGTAKIKIIAPGKGSSGYYSKEMLKRDLAKAFPKGTHMYWNHITPTESLERPERDLNDLAAVFLSDPVYLDNGPAGPGGYVDVDVKEHYRDRVDELAEDIGTSIFGLGRGDDGVVDGESMKIIEELIPDPFNTVDFVTKPGAGGKVLSLFEAARRKPVQPGEAPSSEAPSPTSQQSESEDSPQITTPQEENVTEAEIQAMKEKLDALEAENATLRESSGRQNEALLLIQARTVVTEALAAVTMPEPTRKRLTEALVVAPVVDDKGALDIVAYKAKIAEAAQAEVDYLASLVSEGGSGGIRGMNSATQAQPEQLDEAALNAQLEEAFVGLGLSESAAKIAATAR
jgi:hypothetical protein